MPRISAYAASKAAIVRFAESLALEVGEFGIDVNALAPGALDTKMLGECRRIFANAGNTARRAQRYNGLDVAPLYHPPRLADRLHGGDVDDEVAPAVVGRHRPEQSHRTAETHVTEPRVSVHRA